MDLFKNCIEFICRLFFTKSLSRESSIRWLWPILGHVCMPLNLQSIDPIIPLSHTSQRLFPGHLAHGDEAYFTQWSNPSTQCADGLWLRHSGTSVLTLITSPTTRWSIGLHFITPSPTAWPISATVLLYRSKKSCRRRNSSLWSNGRRSMPGVPRLTGWGSALCAVNPTCSCWEVNQTPEHCCSANRGRLGRSL